MLSSGKSYCSLYIVFSLTVAHAVDATAHTNGINFFMVVFISLSSLVNVNVVSNLNTKYLFCQYIFVKYVVALGDYFLLWFGHGKSIYSSSYAFSFFSWRQYFECGHDSKIVRGGWHVCVCIDGY